MKLIHRSAIFCCAILTISSLAFGAGLKESWYIYRGQENMKIKNYKAAIEAYEKATELNPENREASKDLGFSYEQQGMVDKAVGEYDRYLKKWPEDNAISLRQARLLRWSRYSYRQQDAVKFYKASLAEKSDPQVRLEYADLLASKKETSGEAIREYEKVLSTQPRNPSAHKGLAKVYAWNGNKDQALHHSRLAREYGDTSGEAKSLQGSLEKDRRPEAGAELWILSQTSTKEYELTGLRLGAFSHFGMTPFTSGRVRGGSEMLWNNSHQASSGYLGLGVQYRFGQESAIDVDAVYHGISADHFELKAQYSTEDSESSWRAGVERSIIYDSYMSAAGLTVNSKALGAARRNVLFVEWKGTTPHWKYLLSPYAGFVSSGSVSSNSVIGADLNASWIREPAAEWTVVSTTRALSFQRDHSGFAEAATPPMAGGYFSPALFFEQGLLAHYEPAAADNDKWFAELGPSYQHVKDSTGSGAKWGGRFKGSYLHEFRSNLYLQLQGEVVQVSDIFTQVIASGWLSYKL